MKKNRLVLLASISLLTVMGCNDEITTHLWQYKGGCQSDEQCTDSLKPVCDTSAHVCVECNVSKDCKNDAKPICDVSSHVCVEGCNTNDDCTDAAVPVCDTASHVCVECNGSKDCKSDAKPICNVLSHVCVEGCNTNDDCTDAAVPVCDTVSHVCVECTVNSDCKDSAKPVCDTSAKVCVECGSNDDCLEKNRPICDSSSHVCVPCDASHTCTAGVCQDNGACFECSSDSDCTSSDKPRCHLDSNRCVACLTGADCDSGVCVDYLCRECDDTHPCTDSSKHCGTQGEIANMCVVCTEDAHCAEGLVCDVTHGVCMECNTNTECENLYPNGEKPICAIEGADAHTCVECNSDLDCSGNATCDISSHICTGCVTSSDCKEVTLPICQISTDGNYCQKCEKNEECAEKDGMYPICNTDAGSCVECNTVTDCGDGMKFCEDHTCGNCHDNSDCESGICVDNICKECDETHPCTVGVCILTGPNANMCMECQTDAECQSADKPHCAEIGVNQNHCVPCTSDEQCAANGDDKPYCAEAGRKANTCVVCKTDEHCASLENTNHCAVGDSVSDDYLNTCVVCSSNTDKTQCTSVVTEPICDVASSFTCKECKTNEECKLKDSKVPVCHTDGSCVECLTSADCEKGNCDEARHVCVECLTDDECTDVSKAVCSLSDPDMNLCVPCNLNTNCIGGVCNATTGKCDPCAEDAECVTVERGVCFIYSDQTQGKCEKCDESTNCLQMCNATTGKCEPCNETNCNMACNPVTERCEPCNNDTLECAKGVCNETSGQCEPCNESTNCKDGACGTDGLCHKKCEEGTTLCGHDVSTETCCTADQICSSYGICLDAGDGCTSDADCPLTEICDIPVSAEKGTCIPIDSDPQACFTIPEFETISPVVKWHYEDKVVSSPVVMDLTGDGVPEVIFTNNSYILTAVDGQTGKAVATTSEKIYNKHNDIASGDVDGDGVVEVVVPSASKDKNKTGLYTLALVKDGSSYQWKQKGFVNITDDIATGSDIYWADLHPTLADLEGDTIPDIVTTRGIIHGNDLNSLHCSYKMNRQGTWYYDLFAVADLDQDGNMEIIADVMYDKDCNKIMDIPSKETKWAYTAVADILPSDGKAGELVPEIVRTKPVSKDEGYVSVWKVYKNGSTWTQEKVWETKHPGGGGGNPVIADFDGDGKAEIGVAGGSKYAVFKNDGTVLWSSKTDDSSSYRTGSSVFDFEADGKAEVVYRDQQKLRIYNGLDGKVLWETKSTSGTVIDYPLIVDVDGDGQTEIVVVSEPKDPYTSDYLGVTVYADANHKWVRTRKVWNQHSYHVTNINDDGSIPQHEEANWLNKRLNNYRQNVQPTGVYNQPNFVPGVLVEDRTACDQTPPMDGFEATIANIGGLDITSDIYISFYIEDTSGNQYYVGTSTIHGLAVGAKGSAKLQWDMKTAYPIVDGAISNTPTTLSSIVGYKAIFRVDDPGNTDGVQHDECNETDNELKTSKYISLVGC